MTHQDYTRELQHLVEEAGTSRRALQLVGGDSKSFYGRAPLGERVDLKRHTGIIHYEPTELVITAQAGTPLREIEAVLAEHNQMLAFEPPHFGEHATLGGTIACGLSGPRRPYAGSARDYVLGMRILNGKGQVLRFGGEVMKNVAGYDVSRLMTGALGTLGIILDVSLKVLPRPELEITRVFEQDAATAITHMNILAGQPIPLSGAAHLAGRTHLRVSGTERAVEAAARQLGGEALEEANEFWHGVREQTLPFFTKTQPLWRLSLPAATPVMDLTGEILLDWGGAQRWYFSENSAEAMHALAAQHKGHASLFRQGDRRQEVFSPLPTALKKIHMDLKLAFDPYCIFNQGRMYTDF